MYNIHTENIILLFINKHTKALMRRAAQETKSISALTVRYRGWTQSFCTLFSLWMSCFLRPSRGVSVQMLLTSGCCDRRRWSSMSELLVWDPPLSSSPPPPRAAEETGMKVIQEGRWSHDAYVEANEPMGEYWTRGTARSRYSWGGGRKNYYSCSDIFYFNIFYPSGPPENLVTKAKLTQELSSVFVQKYWGDVHSVIPDVLFLFHLFHLYFYQENFTQIKNLAKTSSSTKFQTPNLSQPLISQRSGRKLCRKLQ